MYQQNNGKRRRPKNRSENHITLNRNFLSEREEVQQCLNGKKHCGLFLSCLKLEHNLMPEKSNLLLSLQNGEVTIVLIILRTACVKSVKVRTSYCCRSVREQREGGCLPQKKYIISWNLRLGNIPNLHSMGLTQKCITKLYRRLSSFRFAERFFVLLSFAPKTSKRYACSIWETKRFSCNIFVAYGLRLDSSEFSRSLIKYCQKKICSQPFV